MTQRPQGKCHRKSLSLIEQSSLTRKPCRSMEPAPQRALASPFVCRVYSFTQLAGSAPFGKQKEEQSEQVYDCLSRVRGRRLYRVH